VDERQALSKRIRDLELELARLREQAKVEAFRGALSSLPNLSTEMHAVVCFDGGFLHTCETFQRFLGCDTDTLGRMNLADFVHPDDYDPSTRAFRGASGKGSVVEFDSRLRASDGEYRWVKWRCSVVDESRRVFCVCRDVHRDKNLEAELRQAQRLESIGRIAGGVAHDFNNLLSVILTTAEVLESQIANVDIQTDIGVIQTAARRGADLTHQLLAFASKQIVHLQVVNINELIVNLQKMLTRVLGADIELVCDLPGTVRRVEVDATLFEQVVINLAANARAAMPDGGQLTIRSRNVHLVEDSELAPGDYVSIAVADTGTGMEPEVAKHVFEPFFTTREEGNGLGLATCYGIIKQFQGQISLSTAVGEGTEFNLILPASQSLLARPRMLKSAGYSGTRGSEIILLVETDPILRKALSRGLTLRGYRVFEAENPHAALSILDHVGKMVDVVVANLTMPDMTGWQLREEVLQGQPRMPMVLVSAGDKPTDVREEMDPSVTFLAKPYSVGTLARLIRELFPTEVLVSPCSP